MTSEAALARTALGCWASLLGCRTSRGRSFCRRANDLKYVPRLCADEKAGATAARAAAR